MPKSIELLDWDSNFFDRRVGRLNLKEATSIDEVLQSADRQRYDLLYIYSPIPIARSLIGRYTLLDVGGHIKFEKDLSSHTPKEAEIIVAISEFQPKKITPELLEIAFISGHLSRFKIDSSLPTGSFESLYKTWLANSLESRPETAIYIYQCDERIAGLITCEFRDFQCTIGLLAVSKSYQRKGIATRLLRYVQEMCIKNNVTLVEVKTQLSNKCARDLYLKNSFEERERFHVYHAHNIRQPKP